MMVTRRSLLAALITAGGGCATAGPDPTRTPSPTSAPSAADAVDATATRTPSPTRSPTATSTPAADVVIDVGPDGALRFEPVSFSIEAGETVRWAFQSPGHNVKALSTPDTSEWTGTPGDEYDTLPAGARYHYSFGVPGEYEYYCVPHLGNGMTGSFYVDG